MRVCTGCAYQRLTPFMTVDGIETPYHDSVFW
eukprot:COSAG02_NODE_75314_length_147_cov_18.020833_1_plen_31_part_01